MSSYVVATAGHVDHGKSTLVRALTGMEPDRWAEERRRGLTIDLGFAWTTLPSGRDVAFVDVPGHQRFLGNMLAGIGPAPVVCFVVAADEGWSAQSGDHRDAVAALGISHGVLVVTRADRAPDRAEDCLAAARRELASTGLADAPAVVVSAVRGTGLDELRASLDEVLATVPAADPGDRVRLWVDRSFSITGAGTVVTGTLASGSLERGDRLEAVGRDGRHGVAVRALQSRGADRDRIEPVDRAAVNLRGVASEAVARGDALMTPGAWRATDQVDVRRAVGTELDDAPGQLVVHVGTAAVPARVRAFDAAHARLTLAWPLPIVAGDRLLLRDPGGRRIFGGAWVLDPDPPALRRRGDGGRRTASLAAMSTTGDVAVTVTRHGAVRRSALAKLGLQLPPTLPAGIVELDGWWVDERAYGGWRDRARALVEEAHDRDPLAGGVSLETLRAALGEPAATFVSRLAVDAGLEQAGGQVRLAGGGAELGAAESGLAALEERLADAPFQAPEADELAALALGPRELAAAERLGRLLRVGDVVLLPQAPALAMRELARLPQPFTASAARQALGTSRRVVIPLLEHLDRKGWTRRVDTAHREVVR